MRGFSADFLAIFFKQIALLTTIVVLITTQICRWLKLICPLPGVVRGWEKFYACPFFTCAGLMWMASAVDFMMIFVSLELVTISFYILVSYLRQDRGSLEAGVKFLVLGALSTGFLVYGITYAHLYAIAAVIPALKQAAAPALLLALGLSLFPSDSKWPLFPSNFGYPMFTKVPQRQLPPSFRWPQKRLDLSFYFA